LTFFELIEFRKKWLSKQEVEDLILELSFGSHINCGYQYLIAQRMAVLIALLQDTAKKLDWSL